MQIAIKCNTQKNQTYKFLIRLFKWWICVCMIADIITIYAIELELIIN